MPPDPTAPAPRGQSAARRARLRAILIPLALATLAVRVLVLGLAPPARDGVHYVTFAYNLYAHGTFGRARDADPAPSNYREPLWPALLALGMALHPGLDAGPRTGPCLWDGEEACLPALAHLKAWNAVLLVATALLAASAAFALTGGVAPGVLAFLLVAFSLGLGREADRFYSEVAAATALAALSRALLAAADRPQSRRLAAGTGALVGALALVKAIFQPLLVLVPGLLAARAWARVGRAPALRSAALALLGGLLVAGPWMLRNEIRFGTARISAREDNLLFRAYLSHLPLADWGAAFLYFTPEVSWLRGPKRALEASGRTRLLDDRDPEGAYARVHARLRALKRAAAARGGDWDRLAGAEALAEIRADPLGYLAMSAPLAWRGIFAEEGWGLERPRRGVSLAERALGIPAPALRLVPRRREAQLASSLALFAAFVGCGVVGLARRRWDLVFFVLPSAYAFASYVAVSLMWPRFSAPCLPIWAVCAVVLATGAARAAARWARR